MRQIKSSLRRRLGGLGLLGVLALAGACYNPNLSRVLYKCDNGTVCPDGLQCINKKHCTMATPACSLGGIMISPDTFVCPGLDNICQPGYQQCPPAVTTDLCHLDILSSGNPENCAICCKDNSDMSRATPADLSR